MQVENEAWREQIKHVFHWRNVLRMIIPIFFIEMIALAFGLAFILIAHGIAFIMLRLALYWQPAYSLFINAARLSDVPDQLPKHHLNRSSIFYLLFRLTPYFFLICAGIWLLFELGFCEQNLIWMLLDK